MTPWFSRLEAICGARTTGEWRHYPIHGKDYGEVFGPKPLSSGDDRIILGSASDAAFISTMGTIADEVLAVVRVADKVDIACSDPGQEIVGETTHGFNICRQVLCDKCTYCQLHAALAALKAKCEGLDK